MPQAIPKAFTPAGWNDVQGEMTKKEAKLSVTSRSNLQEVMGQQRMADTQRGFAVTAEGRQPPHGWAWFNKAGAGFSDAFDTEKITRKNFPAQPVFDMQRAAGIGVEEQRRNITARHSYSGRLGFLDRSRTQEELAMALTPSSSPSNGRTWSQSPMANHRRAGLSLNEATRRLGGSGRSAANLDRSLDYATVANWAGGTGSPLHRSASMLSSTVRSPAGSPIGMTRSLSDVDWHCYHVN